MSKQAMREEAERLIRETMEKKALVVKQGECAGRADVNPENAHRRLLLTGPVRAPGRGVRPTRRPLRLPRPQSEGQASSLQGIRTTAPPRLDRRAISTSAFCGHGRDRRPADARERVGRAWSAVEWGVCLRDRRGIEAQV